MATVATNVTDTFFSALWAQYIAVAPHAARIRSLLATPEKPLVNDHVAFRTFNTAPINIESIQPWLTQLGYVPLDDYVFEDKKLLAKSFVKQDSPQDLENYAPLIFFSELEVDKLSAKAQRIIHKLLEQLDTSKLNGPEFFYSGQLWPAPDFEQYSSLLVESEYAAWLSVMGMRANHFTVLVNALESFHSLPELLSFLEQQGYTMNESGGKIKGSPAVLLEQSSTMADVQPYTFSDRHVEKLPTCFYEFALRYQTAEGKLYQGFVPANADKIFESTHKR
ncbi:MAG TPA: DUF1338 domain-containing protein [Pseudomonadales bacterium]